MAAIGSLDVGQVYDLALAGGFAYLPRGESGLQPLVKDELVIVDIRRPEAPSIVGIVAMPVADVIGMAVGDGYLFLSDYNANIVAFSLDDPIRPRLIGIAAALPGIRPDIAWSDGTLYAIVHNDGEQPGELVAFDTADPVHLVVRSRMTIGNQVQTGPRNTALFELDLARRELVVHAILNWSRPPGLFVADIDDPGALESVPVETSLSWAADIAIAGNRMYVAQGEWGVAAYDWPPEPLR